MSVDMYAVQLGYSEHAIKIYITDNPIRQYRFQNIKMSLSDLLMIGSWIGYDTHHVNEHLWYMHLRWCDTFWPERVPSWIKWKIVAAYDEIDD